MALRRTLAKRLLNITRTPSPAGTLEHSPISSPSFQNLVPSNAVKTNFHDHFLDSSDNGFFRRFLQRRALNQLARLPEFLSVPVGDKLREKLRGLNGTGERLRLDGLSPPAPAMRDSLDGISVEDARKLLKVSQVEKLKWTLRQIPKNSIPYSEFIQICVEVCSNKDQGAEFAKMLDESWSVIVLGNIVFLRPEQVAKSMETLISQSIATPNDPRREELEQMEKQKSVIDQKAKTLVQGELYCGLGFPGSPDTGLHEAHLLGTELGCDGAHLLLRDLAPLCRRLCLFPQNLQRTVVRGVLPAPIQGQAKAVDEDPQL